jgi:CRISPR-associated protein Cmr6
MANNFDIENTILPKNTKEVLAKYVKNSPEKIDNFSLQLNKCANFFQEKDTLIKCTFDEKEKIKPFFYKNKKKVLEFTLYPCFNKVDLNNVNKNFRKALNICSHTRSITNLTLEWRLAIGMGNASVFENSITLHHVYGFPYLPASSIKGIANHWAQAQGYHNSDSDYVAIFGTDEKKGSVIFFDAYPNKLENGFDNNSSVQPDIMNNHFQDYYNGDKPPADWQSPNPVFFLTIKNTKFDFYLGIKDANTALLDKAKDWLIKALVNYGIGAKTAVGYGYFGGAK